MNIISIIIIVLLFASALLGWHSGLMKKLNRVLAVFLSAFLVSALLPVAVNIIKTRTPVYGYLQEWCGSGIDHLMENALPEAEIDRDTVKYLMDQYGMDSSIVDQLTESQLRSQVEAYFPDLLSQQNDVLSSLTRIQQTDLIRKLPVPAFLQNLMINYNNAEGYRAFDASNFREYLAGFAANVILNMLSFAAAMFFSWLIIWSILSALDLFAHLPIIRSVNKAGGLLIGLLQGVLLIWALSLVITLISGTQWGSLITNLTEESTLYGIINERNLFLHLITGALGQI